ncbi:MAG: AbrB/MazE/SpoVT family DNA-binding domain-containing protein [Thermodesulfovibrionales bacterium]
MTIVTTTEKGQVVIPADIRKRHHIAKGTKLAIFEKGNEIIIRPLLREPVKDARGFFKEGKSALQALMTDRKEEAKK